MREADGRRWMEKVECSSGELADQYEGWKNQQGEGEARAKPTSVMKDPAKHSSGNQSYNALIENLQVNVSSSLR